MAYVAVNGVRCVIGSLNGAWVVINGGHIWVTPGPALAASPRTLNSHTPVNTIDSHPFTNTLVSDEPTDTYDARIFTNAFDSREPTGVYYPSPDD